jgi:hypothetical protein
MARCREKNAKGEPCRAPASLVDPLSRCCPAHGPGAKERLSEQGKVGAQVTKQVRRKGKGLRPGELGPLNAPEDAKRWLRIIGRAVAEGRLRSRDGDAATRAVREWLRAYDVGTVAERLEQLQMHVEQLKGGKKLRSVK